MRNTLQSRQKAIARTIKTLLCAAAVLFTAGGVYAQGERVLFPAREVTAGKVFGVIENQTAYRFAAERGMPDPDRTVLLSGNVLTVGELLEQVLAGTGFTYGVDGRRIIIEPVPENGSEPDNLQFRTAHSHEDTTGGIAAGRRPGYWLSTGSEGESIEIVMINFRVNRSLLMREYMNNNHALDLLDRTLSDSSAAEMDYITITAAASPEGNAKFNAKLAEDRAAAIKSYIMWRHPHIDRNRILLRPIGEDWAGLKKMVEDDPRTPARGEVLELLGGGAAPAVKKTRLREIQNGRAYSYIAENMLPYLRGGAACMIYYKGAPEEPDSESDPTAPEIRYIEKVRVDTVYVDREKVIEITPEPLPKEKKIYYLALKTNLLSDALLLPNLAVEFSLPRRWSITAEGHWSWWNSDRGRHSYHRVQFAGAEVRKWLGRADRTPFTGHYLGVYGMGGNYDMRFGNVGRLAESGSWSAGVSYGYATPIGRSFNLEFGIGVGYFGGPYKKYTYDALNDRYPWQSDHRLDYVGLTKAKVSVVWLVGSGKNPGRKR